MLNLQSPIPLYHQLADILMARIETGEFPAGSRLPSENLLASQYDIGRPTVRQATELLVRKGRLQRRRGAGTFVRAAGEEVDLFSLAGTMASFKQKGICLDTSICRVLRLENIARDGENPFSGQKAYFFSRLSRAAQQPVLIEDIFLDPVVFKDIELMDLAGQSLSRIVADRFHLCPIGGKQNFRISYLDREKTNHLGIKTTTPVLTVKRWLHFRPKQSAIFAVLHCRTDQFVFSQVLGGVEHA
jgi:GntR family transcriptional regulator